MQTMPAYLGYGRGWESVAPVPGAAAMLGQLKATWELGLASNASESEEDEIRAALDTMGVGVLMDRIYTYRSVGRPKPWPDFWMHVLSDLGVQPSRVVMVGDDFMGDVWGAVNVGMSGIWLNRQSKDVREGERYGTIHEYSELPAMLAVLGFEGA